MYNSIVCRYHEIAIKGANRSIFEQRLMDEIHHLLRPMGEIRTRKVRGRIWIERPDHAPFAPEDIHFAKQQLPKAFGLESFSPAIKVEPDMEEIKSALDGIADEIFLPALSGRDQIKFRIRARRSDKNFPLRSKDIEIALATVCGNRYGREHLKLDLDEADVTVGCEVREEFALLFFESFDGPGGLPIAPKERVLALLSGGIDSPVACYSMMKRGAAVDFLSFHSSPYTPPETNDKIERIANYIAGFEFSAKLYFCNISEMQKLIRDNCNPRFRTVLYRRMMFRVGQIIARRNRCFALLTGESLGQVASQTLVNMDTIGNAVDMLILRPLVGMDKLEAIRIAEKIGTFELSKEQVPDSCTVFAPDNPATSICRAAAEKEEAKIPNYLELIEKIAAEAEIIALPLKA